MIERFFISCKQQIRHTLANLSFRILCCLNHSGKLRYHTALFCKKPLGFEKRMCKTIDVVIPVLYKHYIEACEALSKMVDCKPLTNKNCTIHATNVQFQQGTRPMGPFSKNKHYYSGKHSLYSSKTEILVTSTKQAVFASDYVPKIVHDMKLFRKSLQKNKFTQELKIIHFVKNITCYLLRFISTHGLFYVTKPTRGSTK